MCRHVEADWELAAQQAAAAGGSGLSRPVLAHLPRQPGPQHGGFSGEEHP